MAGSLECIDIGGLFEGPAGETDAAIWAGLKKTGAILISGFPGAEQIDARARAGLKVFDLPGKVRARITARHFTTDTPNWYRGYWPRSPDRLLQNDFFDVGPENPEPGPDLPGMEILTERTPWPDPAPSPDWAREIRAHYDHLNEIAQALIASIGRSAGFEDDTIIARFAGAHSTLRFLDYPADQAGVRVASDGARVAGGRHTDASGLSLLWQAQPGLQAEGPDEVFRDIPVLPNVLSVHVGDVMTHLTAGAVPATPHRVLATEGPRQSVGFFLEPALSAVVTPAGHRAAPRIEDTYGWQLLHTFAGRGVWRDVITDPAATKTG